jgi:hypothetical protein
MEVWKKSVVILDESDWLMFDGTVDQIHQRLKMFSQAESIIGLTGSTLTSKELFCV